MPCIDPGNSSVDRRVVEQNERNALICLWRPVGGEFYVRAVSRKICEFDNRDAGACPDRSVLRYDVAFVIASLVAMEGLDRLEVFDIR